MKHYKDPVIKQPRQDLVDFPCLDLCDRGGPGGRKDMDGVPGRKNYGVFCVFWCL